MSIAEKSGQRLDLTHRPKSISGLPVIALAVALYKITGVLGGGGPLEDVWEWIATGGAKCCRTLHFFGRWIRIVFDRWSSQVTRSIEFPRCKTELLARLDEIKAVRVIEGRSSDGSFFNYYLMLEDRRVPLLPIYAGHRLDKALAEEVESWIKQVAVRTRYNQSMRFA